MYEPNILEEIGNEKNIRGLIFGQKSQNLQSSHDLYVGNDTDLTKQTKNNIINKNNSKIQNNGVVYNINNKSQNIINNNISNKKNNNNHVYKSKNFSINNYNIESTNTNINSNQISNNTNPINKNKNKKKKSKRKNNMFKNTYYNNYYNKNIRRNIPNLKYEEDTLDKKVNKIKYLDWTENNTLQGQTISNQMNSTDHVIKKSNKKKKIDKKIKKNSKKKKKDISKLKENEIFNIDFYSESSQSFEDKNKSKEISSSSTLKEEGMDDYKEILFKIKLTKEEYRLYLREKAKIISPLK